MYFTDYLRRYALSKHISQKPRERDMHKTPIPRLGGLAIAGAFWLTIIFVLIVSPANFNFSGNIIHGLDKNLWGVIFGSLIILAVTVRDDLKGIKWFWKLLAQFLSAIVVAGFGITIHWFSNPFGGLINLNGELFSLFGIAITFEQIFVVLWIVAIMQRFRLHPVRGI
jgi:UDP-GlcNAc:undecaprenyl-phosphate GlcNAc-1-phosphate transferase